MPVLQAPHAAAIPDSAAAIDARKKVDASLLLMLTLGSLTAFGSLSIDMYLPSFVNIAAELKTTLPLVQLSLATFFVGMASGQLLYGPAADRFGRKAPLYVGLIIYTLASMACALAPNIQTLIVCRFLQALGACSGMVIARAVVRDVFDPQHAARVFSLLMLVMGVAPILAPLLGSYLAASLGWRSIFWVLSGFSSLCLLNVVFVLPETHRPDASVRLADAPAIYRGILTNRLFLGYTLAGGIAQAGMFAYITESPSVFIKLFGVPAEHFAWVFGCNALGLIICSQINGRLLRTFPFQKILSRALWVLAGCGATLILAGVLAPGFWEIAVPLFLFMATLGTTFPNSSAGALSAVPVASMGSASALLGAMQFGTSALVSATVTRLHNGSALPMAATMGACGIIALLLYRGMVVRHPQPEAAAEAEAEAVV
jgi:DHA1 family bicyclomycin/chloramphenicol resistance-like MFS transporter